MEEDKKKVKKIDTTRKIRLNIAPVKREAKPASSNNIKMIFVIGIALVGAGIYYYAFFTQPAAVVAQAPKLKVQKKLLPKKLPKKVAKKQDAPDLSQIILSQKCILENLIPICNKLSSFRSLSGLEGAYSIVNTLYIAIDVRKTLPKLLSMELQDKDKLELLRSFSKNYSRLLHPLKFKNNDYKYKKVDSSLDHTLPLLISHYYLSGIVESELKGFDEIYLVAFEVNGSEVDTKVIIKEKTVDLLKKMNSINSSSISLYFYSGVQDSFKILSQNFNRL